MNAEPTEADKEMKLSGTELCTSWEGLLGYNGMEA